MAVLLLDDTPLTRECLCMSLNACGRGLHVRTAASADELTATLRRGDAPDVVLCNIGGARLSDPATAARVGGLMAALGPLPLIVLSDHEDIADVLEGFRLGLRGYIATSLGLSVALEAIRLVAAGGTFIPAASLDALVHAPPRAAGAGNTSPPGGDEDADADARDAPHGLTPRQLTVLRCLREGKANKVIAHELGMRESTVKVHVRNILKRLGASNRTQAVYLTYARPPG